MEKSAATNTRSWAYIALHFGIRVLLPYFLSRGLNSAVELNNVFIVGLTKLGLGLLLDLVALLGLFTIIYMVLKKLRPDPPVQEKKVIWKKDEH
jgi:hypothetical protein